MLIEIRSLGLYENTDYYFNTIDKNLDDIDLRIKFVFKNDQFTLDASEKSFIKIEYYDINLFLRLYYEFKEYGIYLKYSDISSVNCYIFDLSNEEDTTTKTLLFGNDEDRIKLTSYSYTLPFLMRDESDDVRIAVVEQGYELSKFMNDSSPRVRAEVARQGYGIDKLANDENGLVIEAVSEWINRE